MIDTIDNLTLKYLMNKDQYLKHVNGDKERTLDKKDKKFYKRRIFDLTKKLLNNEITERTYPDIKGAFDDYSKICIQYFKLQDKADIIQEDYGLEDTVLNDSIKIENQVVPSNLDEVNQILIRSISLREPNSLEKLVKRTILKKTKKPIILPQQKNINLKDPILKNKGILKKNNIDINHEEKTNA